MAVTQKNDFLKTLLAFMLCFMCMTQHSLADGLNILVFGHSIAVDCTELLPGIVSSAGIDDVTIARFIKGNCSLKEHYEYFTSDSTSFYSECEAGETEFRNVRKTVREAVESRRWDYVVFQTSLEDEGRYETIEPYLGNLIEYIYKTSRKKFGSEPVFAWNAFWPISKLAEETNNDVLKYRLSFYGNSSQKTYEAYMDVAGKVLNSSRISLVIPSGTAVMNARCSSLSANANEFTRDTYHLSEGSGRYIAACTWFESLIAPKYGKSVLGNTFRTDGTPVPVTDSWVAGVLQLCAAEAVRNPYTVTRVDEHWYLPHYESQWKGKTVVFLGDSITDPNQVGNNNDIYCNMLDKILGINHYNFAVNGSQLTNILPQAARMEKQLGDNFDAIVIFCGTNDYNSSVHMGQWYSETTVTTNSHGRKIPLRHREFAKTSDTFRGRLNIVLDSLKSHYPTKQIILLTPIHRSHANFGGNNVQPDEHYANERGLYVEEYVKAEREAGGIWSVPVIDLYSLCGLQPMLESNERFFRLPKEKPSGAHDLLHPNTEGQIRIAMTVACQLMALPSSFPIPDICPVPEK